MASSHACLQKFSSPYVLSPGDRDLGSSPYKYPKCSSFGPQRDHWTGHSHCAKGKGIASKCHRVIGLQSYPLLTICVPDAVPDAGVLGLSLDSDLRERKTSGRAGPGPGVKSIEALALSLYGDTCCCRLSGESDPLLE